MKTKPTPASDFPVKNVDFAYPTSISAARFGFPKTGCYVVKISTRTKDHAGRDCITSEAISGHEFESNAVRAAVALPNKWAGWAKPEHIEAEATADRLAEMSAFCD